MSRIQKQLSGRIVPVNNYITSGLWRINFIPDKIRTGFFDMWLPAAASLNPKTGFTRPDSSLTYTVPSTSSNVITVGSYNAATNTPSPFSGRGYVTQSESGIAVKPDILRNVLWNYYTHMAVIKSRKLYTLCHAHFPPPGNIIRYIHSTIHSVI